MKLLFLISLLISLPLHAIIVRGESREQVIEIPENKGQERIARFTGQLRVYHDKKSSKYLACTGTVVAKSLVVTAAHCVVNSANGKVIKNIEFFPRYLGADKYFPGRFYASKIWVSKAYLKAAKRRAFDAHGKIGELNFEEIQNDLAYIEFEVDAAGEELVNLTGSIGSFITQVDNKNMPDEEEFYDMSLASYPGDKPAGTMWYEECYVNGIAPRAAVTSCDVFKGSSGGGVFQYDEKYKRSYIKGVISSEDSNLNLVTWFDKVTYGAFQKIKGGEGSKQSYFRSFEAKSNKVTTMYVLNKCQEELNFLGRIKVDGEWKIKRSKKLKFGQVFKLGKSDLDHFYFYATDFHGDNIWDDRNSDVRGQLLENLWVRLRKWDGYISKSDNFLKLTCN